MKEKTLFEDFTTLHWVKWTDRQPEWNGSVTIRWNGKYTSDGTVHHKQLTSLDGEETKYYVKGGKIIVDYTENQKHLLEDVYWLEEIIDSEGFNKWQEENSFDNVIKTLTAKFNTDTNMVEIFEDGNLIHEYEVECTEDEWFGTNIKGREVDFNFWEDELDKDKFVLTIYHVVEKDKDGFYHTNTDIFERIPMEIVTK
jgi:hypothetical protein